ncbi:hypothetical protein N9Z27_01935 [Alphaproteobacteria bacterium]|nr:hypothetical protein [Alphaproteobacteria bacterium]
MLAGVLNYPSIYEDVEEEFSQLEFANPAYNAVREKAASFMNTAQDIDKEALNTYLTESGYEKEMSDILHESVYVHAAFVSPGNDPESLRPKWKELHGSLRETLVTREIKEGWKKAFDTANEDEEKVLSSIVVSASGD